MFQALHLSTRHPCECDQQTLHSNGLPSGHGNAQAPPWRMLGPILCNKWICLGRAWTREKFRWAATVPYSGAVLRVPVGMCIFGEQQ